MNQITPLLTPLVSSFTRVSSQFTVPDLIGGVLYKAHAFPLEKVSDLCQISNNSFKEWKMIPNKEKANIFRSFSSNLKANGDLITKEHLKVGIAPAFASFNVEGSINQINHYADLIQTIPDPMINGKESVINEPIGPILSISPWNAPGILAARSIIAPLAAGCSVILKGSHLSPEVSYLIGKQFTDIGGDVPFGTLQVIHTDATSAKECVSELIKNPLIKGINFTGSTKTGREIAKVAGEYLKPALLELGGKNCTIFDKNLNEDLLGKAVQSTIIGGLFNTGQVCMCTDTLYVPNEMKENVESMIKATLESMKNDNALGFYNRVRTIEDHSRIQRILDRAIGKDGFQTLWGGQNANDIHGPIVLTDGHPNSTIWKTEIFGPVICIKGYDSFDQTINEINELGYGLKCSVWTEREHLLPIAREISNGSIHFNAMTIFDEPHLPHGGVGLSGNGRFNSKWGIESFQYAKLITVDK